MTKSDYETCNVNVNSKYTHFETSTTKPKTKLKVHSKHSKIKLTMGCIQSQDGYVPIQQQGDLKWFFKLEPALNELNKHSRNKNILISKEYLHNGNNLRKYAVVSYKFFKTIIHDDKHLYEVILPNRPVKLLFDLEYPSTDNTTAQQTLLEFIQYVIDTFQSVFNETITFPDIVTGGIKSNGDYSYHIIFNSTNHKSFENIESLKSFIRYLEKEILSNADTTAKFTFQENKHKRTKFIFDNAIYNKHRNMRLPLQSKLGSKRILLPLVPHLENNQPDFNSTNLDDYMWSFYGTKNSIPTDFYDTSEIAMEVETIVKKKLPKPLRRFINNVSYTDILLQLKTPNDKDKKIVEISNINDILKCIPNENDLRQPYIVWWSIGVASKRIGITKQAFELWTGESVDNEWNKWDSNTKGYGLNFLMSIASICSRVIDGTVIDEFFKELEPDNEPYPPYNPNKPFDPQTNNPYVRDLTQEIEKADVLLLQSQLGTGKTTQIKNIIKNTKYGKSVIILTPRISFARNMFSVLSRETDYEWVLYKDSDIDKIQSATHLIIQMESLKKLLTTENGKKTLKSFDLVVFDEIESNLTQFSSPTMEGRLKDCMTAFEILLNESKKVIMADAFLSQRSVELCKDFCLSYHIHINPNCPYKRQAIQIFTSDDSKTKFDKDNIEKFIEDRVVNHNEKMYCVITSKKILQNFETDGFIKRLVKKLKFIIQKKEMIEKKTRFWMLKKNGKTTTLLWQRH